ncbi:hypothetical protein MAPG_06369 [Magnaporthiopsis poae ATCC 64411]|uniref:Uncharacterized protein n=1 Tax=Magnaporthiopsis poae (strain ATCC 64411 / 73-15) TaxID=644358 RepID=A0A0C4E1U8_MAGP6|nr:hypothetical protein MAPG_06369 [Magnaporthiopsis poae ATCC 64411]
MREKLGPSACVAKILDKCFQPKEESKYESPRPSFRRARGTSSTRFRVKEVSSSTASGTRRARVELAVGSQASLDASASRQLPRGPQAPEQRPIGRRPFYPSIHYQPRPPEVPGSGPLALASRRHREAGGFAGPQKLAVTFVPKREGVPEREGCFGMA